MSRNRTARRAARAESLDEGMLRLSPKALWAAAKKEPLHFWFLCAYVMVEYVRPQMIYPAIDVLPWGQGTLALTILAFVMSGPKLRRVNVVDVALGLFSAVWFLSVLTAQNPSWAWEFASVYFNWLIVYFLVTHIVTTERRFYIFLGLFLLWSLKMSTFGARTFAMRGFSFTDWGIMGPRGWFQNSGELAVQMCVFFAMSLMFVIALRKRLGRWKTWALLGLMPGTAALTVIASSSRGGQLAMAASIVFLVVLSRHRVRAVIIGALAFVLLWSFVPEEQRARFDAMGDDETSIRRLEYWGDGMEIAARFPLLGIGYDNWIPYYRSHYNAGGELPHNIFVEAAAELGYTGLGALILLMLSSFFLDWKARKLARQIPVWGGFIRLSAFGLDAALVGFMFSGFFVTILYYPYLWVNLSFTAALYDVARRGRIRARRRARSRAEEAVVHRTTPRAAARPLANVHRSRAPGLR